MSSEKDKTRSRILKATWKLLEEQESTEVRMIDIARGAGISRQAVYLHFENRVQYLQKQILAKLRLLTKRVL